MAPPSAWLSQPLCVLLFFSASQWLGVASGSAATADEGPDPTRPRRVAALLAGFVADAAAMPLHWVYDTERIAQILRESGRTREPEFLPVSHAPYYAYPVGEGTPFAEQMFVYTEALANAQSVDPKAIANAYARYYSAAAMAERPFRSYVDNATRGFLANVAAGRRFPHSGAGDSECNAVAHVLPVVAMRAGRSDFLEQAEAAIRVVQNNDDAVAFGLMFARVLERVILGDSVAEALIRTRRAFCKGTGNPNDAFFAHGLGKMEEWSPRPPFDVTLELGQACDFPFHVFTASHLLLHGGAELQFADAVRETIRIGGESATRGSFIGSILAARAGSVEAAIPRSWRERTTHFEVVARLAEAIVDGGAPLSEETRASRPGRGGEGSAAPSVDWLAPRTPPPRPGRGDVGASPRPAGIGPPHVANAPGCVGRSNASTSNATRPPSHPDDLRALRALYFATDGDRWTRNACWLNSSVPLCWWDQVLCDTSTWRVKELRLAANNLVGTLPPEIGGLEQLQVLQVTFNPQLGGRLPDEVGQLHDLRHFYAWNASFRAVPRSLGQLSRLTAIDLTDNALDGVLPAELAQLASVDTAYFDGNPRIVCPLQPPVQAWLQKVKYSAELCGEDAPFFL